MELLGGRGVMVEGECGVCVMVKVVRPELSLGPREVGGWGGEGEESSVLAVICETVRIIYSTTSY